MAVSLLQTQRLMLNRQRTEGNANVDTGYVLAAKVPPDVPPTDILTYGNSVVTLKTVEMSINQQSKCQMEDKLF